MNLNDARAAAWPPTTDEAKRYCEFAEALERKEWSFADASALAGVLWPFIEWGGNAYELRATAWELYAALKQWQEVGTPFEATPDRLVKYLCCNLASMARAAACGYPSDSAVLGGPFVKFTELAGLPAL